MALFLKVVVVLGLFVTTCNSECHWEKKKMIGRGMGPKGCWHDGEFYHLESKWETSDCQECVCYKQGTECCSHDSIAVGYNPKICVAFKVNCTYHVVKKKNHSIPCPFKLLEIDSDSSDSSDEVRGSKSKDSDDDDDEPKIELSAYLELLSYFNTPDDCEEQGGKVKSISKSAEYNHHHDHY